MPTVLPYTSGAPLRAGMVSFVLPGPGRIVTSPHAREMPGMGIVTVPADASADVEIAAAPSS